MKLVLQAADEGGVVKGRHGWILQVKVMAGPGDRRGVRGGPRPGLDVRQSARWLSRATSASFRAARAIAAGVGAS